WPAPARRSRREQLGIASSPARADLRHRRCAPDKCATTPTPADPASRRDPRWSSGRKLPSLAHRHDPAEPPVLAHTTRAADPGILPALAGRTIPLPEDFSLRSVARLRSKRQSLRYRLGSSRGVACADVQLLPPRSAPRFSETTPSTQTAAPA